jgi:molybdopterin-containing oxidoreductase family membrane subunit
MNTATATMARSNTALWGALVGLVVTGAFVLYRLASAGHAAYNTTSNGIQWGLPVVVYDFFLLTSTGLAFVAAIALILELPDFGTIVKRCLWLAICGLVGGATALFLELGYPLRSLWAIPLNFQTKSPLFWKVLFIGFYVIVLLALVARVVRPGWTARSVRALAILLLISSVGVTMIAGSVFGMMAMRPFWFGGEIPVAFLIESVLGGLAFAIFFTYMAHGFSQANLPAGIRALFTGRMPVVFAAVIVAHALFVGARVVSGLWSNADGLQVWDRVVASPLFHFEIWLGIALPLVLMLSPGLRTKGGVQVLTAVLVMLALFMARYTFIVGGQMVPVFKGSWVHGLVQYTPSAAEWVLLLMAIFIANVVNAFGERRYDLSQAPAA